MSNDERVAFESLKIAVIAFVLEPTKYYYIGVGLIMAAISLWRDDPTAFEFLAVGIGFTGLALVCVLIRRLKFWRDIY